MQSTTYKIFSKELASQMGIFLTTTLSFIVAFSWNDAIRKQTVEKRHENGGRVVTPWTFALLITIFALVAVALWTTFYVVNKK